MLVSGHIKCVPREVKMWQPEHSHTRKMASHTTSLNNFGLRLGLTRLFSLLPFPAQSCLPRWAKWGDKTAPRLSPPGKAEMLRPAAGACGQCWGQQGFLHQPSAWGALAPAGSLDGGNHWLTWSSCRRGEVCCLPRLPSSSSLHANTHKTQHGLAFFHHQTLFQILIF